ncbi:thrombospondin type 3 repeat-containing protein, partial [Flavobacteriaceae bacterium]|nr:thrombospondin type 3 repeat-containing protein [Flavobacteriaceae bacterium]
MLTLCIKSVYSQSPILSDYIEFDGSTGYVEIPGDTSNNFGANDAFTFEAWIKISSGPSNNGDKSHIFGRTWSEFYLLNDNGNIKLQGRYRVEYHGNWPIVTSSSSLSLDTWYHVAYSYSKVNGNLSIHINGQLDGNTSSSSFITGGGNSIGLGARIGNYGTSVSGFFNGSIDEARIWNVQRTAEEINSNKSSTQSQNSNLVLYYKLDDGLGSSVIDSSGNNLTGIASGTYQWSRPTVTLTDTDSDNLVSNSDVVTITATFSESMASTPTISLSGILSDVLMSSTASTSIWTYTWTVSTTVTSTTATVSATDLSGNAYSGTDSITFTIDNTTPTVTLTDTDSDNIVSNSDVVTITATFSESMTATPTLSLSGITSNAQMSATTSDTVWTYTWTVSTSVSSATATVSGTDLAGNAYSGTESITFGLQDIPDYLIEDSLVAWYPFNGNANDESGNNLNLQIYGPSLSSDRFNNPNESFIFDGVQNSAEYLKLSDINTLKNNEFTYSVWFNSLEFYPETPTTDPYDYNNLNLQGLISLNSDNDWDIGPALSLKLKNSSNSIIRVTSWSNTNTSTPNKTSSSNLNASVEINKWYHLVYTYYNGNGKVYVNGVLKETFSSTIDYNLQNDLIIGGQRNGTNMDVMGGFNGKIDDIGIWSKALTQEEVIQIYNDSTAPTVTLTDTDSDNNVSNSDVVTITASFSESMSATPTLSLTGIVSDTQMSATASDSVWTYTWTVSTSVSSATATVSGTDLSGNAYSGTDSITFIIDNIAPTVSLTDTDSDNLVSNSDVVTITATFSESMTATPTLSLSGITSNAQMSATTSDTVWTYTWTVSTSVSSATATVSGTDLAGNAYSGTESITFGLQDIPDYLIEDSLVAWYPFNGNANDESGNLYNGTVDGAILSSDRIDVSNSSYSFDGDNDWINFENHPNLKLSGSLTYSAWIFIEGITNVMGIVGTGEATSWDKASSMLLVDTNYNLRFEIGDGSGQGQLSKIIYTDKSLDQNKWYHVVGTFNSSDGVIKLYLNSKLVGSLSTNKTSLLTNIPDSDNKFKIGVRDLFSSGYTYGWFKGKIDDVGVWSKALTQEEVIQIYNDTSSLTVTLTDTDSDNIVSNSDVVTITATFSESMSATPTLSLSGITSNAQMSATTSDTIWTYTWTVSGTSVISTTAIVSGTDLAGNAYAGTESITFTIDNTAPTIINTDSSNDDDYFKGGATVQLSVTFSEAVITPTITIGSDVSNASMTVSASTNSTTWYYDWAVPTGVDGTYVATVSTTDLIGNAYSGTDSVTLTVDNTDPEISSVSINDDNDTITLTFTEPTFIADATSNSYTTTDTTYYLSVNQSGGTATITVDQIRYDSTTDDRVYYLDITVNGTSDGSEQISIAPFSASRFKDRVGNFAATSQTSNTVTLSNTAPQILATSITSDNATVTLQFSESVYRNGSAALTIADFSLVTTGGTAVLTSAAPVSISVSNTLVELGIVFSTPANGLETLTITPAATVLDSSNAAVDFTLTQSNTVTLNDQKAPSITGATLDSQNRHVDIAFSEGIYGSSYAASAVTSSSFTLSQQSGPSYGMTISGITTTAGGVLSGGETTLRFNLESAVKPTGQEVFAITATDSSSVVDSNGNSMTVSQTNNSFQLKPPTSGGVSSQMSTIAVAPVALIGDGINTAVITVQAKDSIGQNFLEGGYQVTLFSPQGDLPTTDNQNGTYTASYIAGIPSGDSQEILFGFRVADTNGSSTALLTVHRDDDGDGVYNINDECPKTKAGLTADATGCALNQLDSDNDGVFDDVDECPDTPEFELNNVQGTPTFGEQIPTVVDEKGCGASQRDTDGDGKVDTEDNCIDTANPDQADNDEDGIGDVCDTDNPLPDITTTEIKFVQLPQNGTTVGKIEATDPDGEVLIFAQAGDNFTGVLSVAADGSITVSSGALLTFDSTYNGTLLGFTVSDGENEVAGSVKIVIEDAPRPPEISIITLEISENAEVGTIVGFVEAKDPMGGQIVSIDFQGDGFIELVDGVLKTVQELDYETTISHPFTITAKASDRTNASGLIGSKTESIRVSDIPNATYTGRFFISIFNVADENLGAKVDFRRYFNPYNKNVGKWKVKKRIKGGADAAKFTVRSGGKSGNQQKNGSPIEDENEDYLEFITPPDFENPGDANKDNIYEVEVEYINTDDGAPEVPIVVTQTNIQVPEGKTTSIELQSQPVLPTDDNDGDGVVDILDNSPLVANPDQSDQDGDGVGDVTDDSDHDGVWNPFDTCPETPLGELVDLDGCLIYYLPASNFSISKTEKCVGENSITINVIDATVDYNVTVSGATNTTEVFTGSSWSLENLSAGEYTLCIGVEGVNPLEFERCFKVMIEESDPLLVSSLYNKENQIVSFDLSGGSAYQITHNGKTTQTSSNKHTVQLDKGINNISISTGIECQGLFEKTYLNSYKVKYAPNPFKGELQLFMGGKDNLIEIGVYASNGQLIDYQTVSLSFGMRNYSLNTSSYK